MLLPGTMGWRGGNSLDAAATAEVATLQLGHNIVMHLLAFAISKVDNLGGGFEYREKWVGL